MIKDVYIGGLTYQLGNNIISSVDMATRFNKNSIIMVNKTGVNKLYRFDKDVDMVYLGASLLTASELKIGRKINSIITAICIGDNKIFPTLGTRIANHLKRDVTTYRSNPGCLGIAHAIRIAFNEVSLADTEKNIAIMSGDYITQHLRDDDYRSQVIFSDALSCIIISNNPTNMLYKIEEQPTITQWHSGFYAMEADPIYSMNASKVVTFVSSKVGPIIKELIRDYYVIPHDASKLSLDSMELVSDKIYTDGIKEGNKTSASTIIGLNNNLDKDRICLVPFGAEYGIGVIKLVKNSFPD